MASSLSASPRAAGRDAIWQRTELGRSGKPSLRFEGCRLYGIEQQIGAQTTVSIALWKRNRSGYALAWTTLATGALAPHAVLLASTPVIMDHPADCCNAVAGATVALQEGALSSQSGVLAFIAELQLQARYQRVFATMTSEALAEWDGWDQD